MTLSCPSCNRRFKDRWRCVCGSPLQFETRPTPSRLVSPIDPRAGLWAFEDFFPESWHPRISLGEGMTPLASASEWEASFKLEYVSPTGSFKDRGATTTISRAAHLGENHVIEDSSGNAGLAIATYAARAGIDATIYAPADAAPKKLEAIRRTGADLRTIEGNRQAVTDACLEAVENDEGWYASHAWNPAFFVGTSTAAIEIAFQRDWQAPDAVVTPVGHGTLLIGLYRGFSALESAGWIARVPRLYAVQAAGVAPIVEALGREAGNSRNEVASGVQIDEPVQRELIIEAITRTNGDAIAVDDTSVMDALGRLHTAGFGCEPTSALGPAGLLRLRDGGSIEIGEDVVVPLTGAN